MESIKLISANCCGEIGDVVVGLEKINYNLEKFHYNGIIANLYEAYNFLIKLINKKIISILDLKNKVKKTSKLKFFITKEN